MLALIAYPGRIPQDHARIVQSRRENPALRYQHIPPHFTFVFPTTALDSGRFIAHVKAQTARQAPILFVIRCALPFRDLSSPNTYLYLVPDEGFSAMVRLHDRLYSGPLAGELRLDIPFVPHITVGYAEDAAVVKHAADAFNSSSFVIKGIIKRLEVIQIEGQHIETLKTTELG